MLRMPLRVGIGGVASSGRELGSVGSDGVEHGGVESGDVLLGGGSSVAGSTAAGSSVVGSMPVLGRVRRRAVGSERGKEPVLIEQVTLINRFKNRIF